MSNAKEFAELVGTQVQPWMEWEGWQGWVGCDQCAGDGPDAPCWGNQGCHGYENGCGCSACIARDYSLQDYARYERLRNRLMVVLEKVSAPPEPLSEADMARIAEHEKLRQDPVYQAQVRREAVEELRKVWRTQFPAYDDYLRETEETDAGPE